MATPTPQWSKNSQGQWVITSGFALRPGSAGVVINAPDGSQVYFTGLNQPAQPVTKDAQGQQRLPNGQDVSGAPFWSTTLKDFIAPAVIGGVTGALAAPGLNSLFSGGGTAAAGAVAGDTAGDAGGQVATAADGSIFDPASPVDGTIIPNNVVSGGGSSFLSNPWTSQIIPDALKLGGTLIANNSVNQAQQVQQQATNTALAQNTAIYNNNRSALQPFIANGTGASNILAKLYGLPTSPVPQNVPVGQSATGVNAGLSPSSAAGFGTPGSSLSAPTLPGGQPAPGTMLPPTTSTLAAPTLSAPGSAPSGSNVVVMKAPDGSIRQVPANLVAQAQQQGGTVVQ